MANYKQEAIEAKQKLADIIGAVSSATSLYAVKKAVRDKTGLTQSNRRKFLQNNLKAALLRLTQRTNVPMRNFDVHVMTNQQMQELTAAINAIIDH